MDRWCLGRARTLVLRRFRFLEAILVIHSVRSAEFSYVISPEVGGRTGCHS